MTKTVEWADIELKYSGYLRESGLRRSVSAEMNDLRIPERLDYGALTASPGGPGEAPGHPPSVMWARQDAFRDYAQ